MFRELEELKIKDTAYLLLDDTGEKVYSNSLEDEYNKLLIANHIVLSFKEMTSKINYAQILFDKINVVVYCIDEYFLFFFSEKLIDKKMIKNFEKVYNKIHDILV
jgi:hypothetical protein